MHEQKRSKDGSIHITDERINTITHMVGAILAFFGGAILIVKAAIEVDVWAVVGMSVYAFTLFFLFLFSTLHHGINGNAITDKILRILDYDGVFLLIAGTMTGVCLLDRSWLAWVVFGVIWLFAILGILLKTWFHVPKWVTNTFYIVLGWIGATIIVFGENTYAPFVLLVSGGLAYTFGFIIYIAEKPNFVPGKFGFHELWHIIVLIGAVLHWFYFFLVL